MCPYCSVGCATLVHTVDDAIVNIEGDPRSPLNEGTLCPKGAAIFQLHVNPNRPTTVLHRAPGATDWEEWPLERAMDRVVELVKKTRDETFIERLPDGKLINATTSIFSLGGATLDVEWNHIQQKLMRGLGVVGEQPFLRPGESFEYTSGTSLGTPVGTMRGSYQMVAEDGQKFEAEIPEFTLSMPRVLH